MKNEAATTAINYKALKVSSSAFENNGMIPIKYTCDGADINPPLDIEHIPVEAKCLVLIVEDPGAVPKTRVHWLAWNIPVTHHLKENEIHGVQGINDSNEQHYNGPCPPSGIHQYFFKIYALNNLLDLPESANKQSLEIAMSDCIIGFGELAGLYETKSG
ncbi:MAG: YbhB/YbcL family Raf kinase inhibitor-like protein [Ferruginibacter sp.]